MNSMESGKRLFVEMLHISIKTIQEAKKLLNIQRNAELPCASNHGLPHDFGFSLRKSRP